MLGWFTHKKTKKLVLLNVTSRFCKGYGIETRAIEVKTGKNVLINMFSEYFPYGKPVKQPFPTVEWQ